MRADAPEAPRRVSTGQLRLGPNRGLACSRCAVGSAHAKQVAVCMHCTAPAAVSDSGHGMTAARAQPAHAQSACA